MDSKKLKRLSNEELSFFTGQVALMLESGIPLYESIEVLSDNYTNTQYEFAFKTIYEATEYGFPLCKAMDDSGIFPRYAVTMVKVGEDTGRLDQVMKALSHHYAREEMLTSSISSAIRYPMVLMTIMAIVVLVLQIKVLPLFNNVLMNLGAGDSAFAGSAMKVGEIINIIALICVGLLLTATAVLLIVIKTNKKSNAISTFSRLIPAIGKLEKAIAAERFLSILSISLKAGYPPESAAETCAELIDDQDALECINKIVKLNEETGSLCDAIIQSGLLAPLKARMIKVGFMTGRQDEVTGSVAELYAAETDIALEKLLAMIEPTLVTILAVIIGCVLLTVMLPLAGIMSSFL